jgi:hypothetical protein
MPTRRSLLASLGVGVTGLAGCLGGGQPGSTSADGDAGTTTGTETPTGTPTATGTPTVPTAEARLAVQYDVEELVSEIRSGGPPKDGIPSIDDPTFLSADEADLDPGDPVFGVVRGDDVRAYRQDVLVWHEIVNDVVDGTPVSVTYCPLTGTAMGFERGDTTFGVSGKLLNSNLVMYDRATDSRWPQVLATAIRGQYEGSSLREFPVTWTTWGAWQSVHPDTTVLSTDTGFARNYGLDPYGEYNPRDGYYAEDRTLFPPLTPDDRFQAKEVFVGVRTADGAAAVRKSTLRESGLVSGTVGGTPLLFVYGPTLDTGYAYLNPDGRSFEYADGTVTAGGEPFAPDALPLDRLVAPDAMWFAWAGFYPETEVYAGDV